MSLLTGGAICHEELSLEICHTSCDSTAIYSLTLNDGTLTFGVNKSNLVGLGSHETERSNNPKTTN